MSAVFSLSLMALELCPLQPRALKIPLSMSISFRVTVASSCPSKPVSFRIVKIVAYLREAADIILSTFCVVGIRGIFLSHLYLGLF